jgi:GH24 family phage-related lysozyme (muramidase)
MGTMTPTQPAAAIEYLEKAMVKIRFWEGTVRWMYLDEPGLVTVGVGQMLPNVNAAQLLPFLIGGQTATAEQIAADYERVKAMRPAQLPPFYCCSSAVTLADGEINLLLLRTVKAIDLELEHAFVRYAQWPTGVKLATIDMVYNLGLSGFREYTHLNAALEIQDWTRAAKECGRNVHLASFAARNYWTRTQFMNAALPAAV